MEKYLYSNDNTKLLTKKLIELCGFQLKENNIFSGQCEKEIVFFRKDLCSWTATGQVLDSWTATGQVLGSWTALEQVWTGLDSDFFVKFGMF